MALQGTLGTLVGMTAGYPENQNDPLPAGRKSKGPRPSEFVAAAAREETRRATEEAMMRSVQRQLPEPTLPPPQPVQLVKPSQPTTARHQSPYPRCGQCHSRIRFPTDDGRCPGCRADLMAPGSILPLNFELGRVALRDALLIRDGLPCHYCKVRPGTTIDEKVPRSRGGKRTMGNCVLACPKCNVRKGSMSYEAFIATFAREEPHHPGLRPVDQTPSGLTIWGMGVDSSSKEV